MSPVIWHGEPGDGARAGWEAVRRLEQARNPGVRMEVVLPVEFARPQRQFDQPPPSGYPVEGPVGAASDRHRG